MLVAVVLSLGCASLRGAQAYRAGNRALERGEAAQAVPEFERAARLLPEQSEIHNHLGMALAQSGRVDDAVREFERAVEFDCDNSAAEQNLSRVLEERAKEERSRQSAASTPANQEMDP